MGSAVRSGDQTLKLLEAYYGLEELYAAFDQAAQELSAAKVAPLCVENCGKCCEANTPYLWEIEAQYIIGIALGNQTITRTKDRCQAWLLDRHKGLSLYGPRADAASEKGKAQILAEVAVTSSKPCAFLDPDKSCAIHEARPLVCRAYGVSRLPWVSECPAPLGPLETASRRARYDNVPLQRAYTKFLSTLAPAWRASYSLPTGIYRLIEPAKFMAMVDRIATAKMVAFPISPAVIWQAQLEAEWAAAGVR